jgi:nitric oxide reductase NorD protein
VSVSETRPVDPARICFSDIQRFLSLFAQGMAGQFIHLKLIEAPKADRGARQIAEGESESIHLPAVIADFATAAHNLGAYRVAVLHQIGYRVEGTFDIDLPCFFASWPRPALLRRVFFSVEDMRIDAALRRRYPGARDDLDRVMAYALRRRPSIRKMRSLSMLMEALLQYSLGATRTALLAQNSSELLAFVIDAAAAVRRCGAVVNDSARAALEICSAIESLFRRSARDARPAVDRDFSMPTEPFSDQGAEHSQEAEPAGEAELFKDDAANPIIEFRGELIRQREFKARRDSQIATGAQQSPVTGILNDQPQSSSPLLTARVRPPRHDGPRSFLYDEWDYHRQCYLATWCRVHEQRLRGDDFAFIDGVRQRYSALEGEIRRQFGFIKPQLWQRVHRTSDGDELELDGVIEAVIDRRSGHATDSHLYLRRDRALRDVAAAFLVDMSASTDFALPDPAAKALAVTPSAQPPDSGLYFYDGHDDAPQAALASKRRVIDVAKEALALMCDALQTLGDSHAIYGFSGDGRDNVEFHVAKDFGDKITAQTWAALGAMQPRRSTRMGAAIRHAITKLAREPASIRVLIIISDGYPEDHDYGADRSDREYGIQDTARALAETKREGIVDFCVTIDPAGHDYLRRMCPESRYLVIDDVAALPRALTKVYQTLTAQH